MPTPSEPQPVLRQAPHRQFEGGRPRRLENTPYHRSKLIGNRATLLLTAAIMVFAPPRFSHSPPNGSAPSGRPTTVCGFATRASCAGPLQPLGRVAYSQRRTDAL